MKQQKQLIFSYRHDKSSAFMRAIGLRAGQLGDVGEDNPYGDAYGRVKRELRLPAALLAEVYGARYATHFYTEQERTKFLDQWKE